MWVLCLQKGWDREVGGVTHGVLRTWQLLGWAVEGPWLAPSGPILALVA